MSSTFTSALLAHPVITAEEVEQIRTQLHADGRLNLDDVKLLVELYCGATKFPPSFRELLFGTLEEVFLADGSIDATEQYYLLKLICGSPNFGPEEKAFVRRIRGRLTRDTADLDAMLAGVL